MNLFPALDFYTREQLSARDAQRMAEFIAFGPIVFQVSRLMLKLGILQLLRDSDTGLTIDEIAAAKGMTHYAVQVLVEASLTIGTVLVDKDSNRFRLAKTGWFLINDPATRVNIDFNNDVNYEGMFRLEQALNEGKPAGLKALGNWPTIYEGLSQLPRHARQSWLAFDHFYSDSAFDEALNIVFERKPKTLCDVGGNTGRWAVRCLKHDPAINVTVLDLPQQIEMMREATQDLAEASRLHGYGIDLLDPEAQFPTEPHFDAVWMSQFLDCFAEDQIVSILGRAAKVMDEHSRLYIMETLWDRQRYEPAAFCLTQVSLYFTAMANGNSKMMHSDDLARLIGQAGLKIEDVHDNLGQGHSIVVCSKP
jgi:hypothetical protein